MSRHCFQFVGILLCLQLLSCSPVIATEQISPQALATQIEQGTAPLILDVRSRQEYTQGHIPGAINIDYRILSNNLSTIDDYRSKDVVVYCERGVRAGVAERTLEEAGFVSILSLNGDIAAWRRAGLPLVVSEQTVGEQTVGEGD